MGKPKTIFVGLSGGVDSSVAALRLLKAGHKVVGVFIKVWHPEFMVCNWEQERLDAMRVAAKLGIPFLTCDAEAAYRDAVAHYFIESYKIGITPNPDVMCNKEVKFGAFMEFAKAHGADHIATGHYAQKIKINHGDALFRGSDTNKDQSYFLWTLTKEQLEYSLFPVGNTNKNIIRKEAEEAGLVTAEKKDSQGICFLGHVDIPEFLSHYINLEPGPVLDENGRVVGEHRGAFVYTLGQRHGFAINDQSANRTPHYVIAKDVANNTITVSNQAPVYQAGNEVTLTSLVIRQTLNVGDSVEFQTRYRQKPATGTIKSITDESAVISVNEMTDRSAIGQSCVLYLGDECIGGGIMA